MKDCDHLDGQGNDEASVMAGKFLVSLLYRICQLQPKALWISCRAHKTCLIASSSCRMGTIDEESYLVSGSQCYKDSNIMHMMWQVISVD